MSGTSIDGVDLAFCEFHYEREWKYRILCAETIPYSDKWINTLTSLMDGDAYNLAYCHVKFGHYLGEIAKEFIARNHLVPDFISSHGHTVFHQPHNGLTLQIGDGNSISATTGLPVIFDFRSLDIALGGQGAPLVPVGDKILFGGYQYCLNLGGISNISYDLENKRSAFDICPVNIVLNHLANKKGLRYDAGGNLASAGKINQILLEKLNDQDYYRIIPPKSLGREWISSHVLPLIVNENDSIENNLRTFTEHIAIQISRVLNQLPNGKILISGGGAKNIFLVDRLKSLIKSQIVIPNSELIDYKEALVFAFLGLLRWLNEINCYSSVTGAQRDSSCGVIVMN